MNYLYDNNPEKKRSFNFETLSFNEFQEVYYSLLEEKKFKKSKKTVDYIYFQMLLIGEERRLRKEYYHNMINDHKIGIYPQSKLITPEWASKMIDKFYNPEMEKFKYFKWTEIYQSEY